MQKKSNATRIACYLGYTVQAIAINFTPLLFVTFTRTFSFSLTQISSLIAVSFIIQLSADALAAIISDRMNYRGIAVCAGIFGCTGLSLLSFLPFVADPFIGVLTATVFCAFSGGMLEVIITPIGEAIPSDNKSAHMSLLHSFYCWGLASVSLVSTLFFAIFGIDNWRYLALVWALVPLTDAILFTKVPIYTLIEKGERGLGLGVFGKGKFYAFLVMMICAGGAEMIMSQWASTFAERSLGVSKAVADLLGPCSFALFMGLSRLIYALVGKRIKIHSFMLISNLLCISAYLLAALVKDSPLALIGCALCGFSVGIMWPGTFSMASEDMPGGGITMFSLLALGGDIGCLVAPTMAGIIAQALGGDLAFSFFLASVFPIVGSINSVYLIILKRIKRKTHTLKGHSNE